MASIFSKRINNVGAIAGMISGLAFTLTYIFIYKGWFFILGTNNLPDTAENRVLGNSPLSIECISALVSFGVTFAVARATKEPLIEIQQLAESVHYPRGANDQKTGASEY